MIHQSSIHYHLQSKPDGVFAAGVYENYIGGSIGVDMSPCEAPLMEFVADCNHNHKTASCCLQDTEILDQTVAGLLPVAAFPAGTDFPELVVVVQVMQTTQ
jgi:hypothetical protein